MIDHPTNPASPPPPRPQLNFAGLLHLRPDRGRLVSAVRATTASGFCLFAGWLLGNEGAGLTACLGAFAALYGSGRPYGNRATLLGLIVCGLVVSVVAGVGAATVNSPWASVAAAALIATFASFLCNALNVGPPGAYMFMLACAAGTSMFGQSSHLPQIALLVAAGGAVSWTLHMVGALWGPRGPERQAVATAALAVADFIDSARRGPSDLARHKAATSLHDVWRALIAWQPARDRPVAKLAQLRALSRQLHGLFAAAVREGSEGRLLDPERSAEARSIGSRVAEVPSEVAPAVLNERRSFFTPREMIATSLTWRAQPLHIALRVGAAALIAGSLGTLMGLERSYWAAAAAMLILHQGFSWVRAMQRGLERTFGTMVGLIVAGGLAWLHPGGLTLVGCIAVLQFAGQLFVASNYALAVFFFTPMALLMATADGASTSDASQLILARGFDTMIGCGVGLAVLLATYRTDTTTVRSVLSETIAAARAVLPFLSRDELTSAAARIARRRLRSNAFELILLHELQAGGTQQARDEADRTWPAIVATQRLTFRILAACWEVESACDAEEAHVRLFGASGEKAIVEALDSLQAGQAATIPHPASGFLVPEIIMLNESLPP